jgi:DNA replicative helicase MCM subunit Mcm2 (Cdc46/Mcm family)
VSKLEFGKSSGNLRYAVIVCPKCREHVQITETGKKTLKCQKCGALLQAKKLRVMYSSEKLADAVTFRTRLQAEISGKGYETFSIESPQENPETDDPEGKEKTIKLPEKKTSEPSSSKKDQRLILLEILKDAGGKIKIEDLQQKALEKGISEEKLNKILKKCLETGEIYSPQPEIIKLI